MKPEKRIITAQIAILIIWLLDSEYLGLQKTVMFRHVFHVIAVIGIGLSGYYSWKKKESWLNFIWVGIYSIALLLVAGYGALIISGLNLSETTRTNIWNIRLFFTSPLPFLALYTLYIFYNRQRKKAG